MPTRLVVLLQSRKSAAAGSPASATAPTVSMPPKRALVRRRRAGCKLVMVRRPFIVPRGGGFHAGRYGLSTTTINHDSAEIVHVGMGSTWSQKVANTGEEFGRIIVTKICSGVEAQLTGALQGRVVHIGAGRIVGAAHAAVGAVGVGGQACDAGLPAKRKGERQRVFLIGTAAPLAAHRHGELAAGQDNGAAALRLQV